MTECGERLGEMCKLIEHRAELTGNLHRVVGRAKQRLTLLEMAIAQCLHSAKRSDKVALG